MPVLSIRLSTVFASLFLLALTPAIAEELVVEFRTGGDDLRGTNDNVHLVVLLRTGAPLRFDNVNDLKGWGGNSMNTVRRPLPRGFNAANIAGIRLETTFGGGVGGDNWNLDAIRVLVRNERGLLPLYQAVGTPLVRFTAEQRAREFHFAAHECTTHSQCDDNRLCNGPERCEPAVVNGFAKWQCRAAPAGSKVCTEGQICDASSNSCISAPQSIDRDGDGVASVETGGADCDDTDANRYPGRAEICDPDGHDEDCDFATGGERDADGDNFTDAACFNWGPAPRG